MGVSITRKSGDLTGWPLRDQSDMFTALAELTAQGWTGAVELDQAGWKLRLSQSGKQTVNALVGQWIVSDGDLKALTQDQFNTGYESDPAVEFPTVDTPAPDPVPEETVFGSQTSPTVAARIVRPTVR